MRTSRSYNLNLRLRKNVSKTKIEVFKVLFSVSYGEGANSRAKYDVCIKRKHQFECHENSPKFKPITIVNLRYRETDLNSHI